MTRAWKEEVAEAVAASRAAVRDAPTRPPLARKLGDVETDTVIAATPAATGPQILFTLHPSSKLHVLSMGSHGSNTHKLRTELAPRPYASVAE